MAGKRKQMSTPQKEIAIALFNVESTSVELQKY
jgi:hypothetical protein